MVQLVNTIKLYKNPIRIQLTQLNKGVRNNNLPLDDNDFRTFKGVTSEIQFSVRNNDRRAINLIGKQIVATVINPETGERMLQRYLDILDDRKGIAVLTLKPTDVVNWNPGFYRYSVLIENEDGTQNLLYMDKNQLGTGYIELQDGNLPEIQQSIELDPSKFTPLGYDFPTPFVSPTRYISSALPGASRLGLTSGLHTFAVFGNKFFGKLRVEGSLEEEPSTNTVSPTTDWFPIQITAEGSTKQLGYIDNGSINYFTGVEAFNFYSNVNWVRFTYEPDPNNNPPEGELTKIQYVP